MKAITSTIILLLGLMIRLSAQEVSEEMAATVARNFLYEKFNQYVQPTAHSLVTVRESLNWEEEDQVLLYIFNMNPAGFVIVSAHQAMPPVPGYSCEHNYRAGNQPPNIRYWIGQYAEQVKLAFDKQLQPDNGIGAHWKKYLDPGFMNQDHAPAQTTVGPLLTSLWDQGWPYNYYCPETPTGGSGGHVWAGCVVTAVTQLMYYYRWPDYGNGRKSYIPLSHPEYGVQSADFGATRYRFEEMVDDPRTVNLAIAEFLYHLGVAYEMDYDPNGSVPTEDDSIPFFFKALNYEFLYRENFTDSAWMALLRYNLDKGMPIYYSGLNSSGSSGHAFVCDGYQDSLFFHFNLGWGGKSNGFYQIDNVVGFNYNQDIVVPTYPDTINYSWPQYLPGKDTLTALEGSITDGSSPLHDYLNNIHYKWLIDPQTDTDSISYITLSVRRFSTAGPGDHLIIYDGADNTSPVLADLSGDTIPPDLVSTANRLLVEFITDASATGPGFLIDYLAEEPEYCKGTQLVTDSSRYITDGSSRFNYNNSTVCKWLIQPEGCDSSLVLHFNWFDTEPEHDYLEIYDPETQVLLAKYSGYYNEPPAPVTSPSGKMFLVFKTNSTITANGWKAWYGDVTGIEKQEIACNLQIIPNPVGEIFDCRFSIVDCRFVSLKIVDLFGREVKSIRVDVKSRGEYTIRIDAYGLTAGIYLIRLQAGSESVTRKIVKL